MKTTLDLPEDLVRRMKLRAVREGRKLKDVASEVFRRGLAASSAGESPTGTRVQLPLIVCERAAPEAELDPEQIGELLTSQEAEWSDEVAGR